MISQINTSHQYNVTSTTKSANQASAEKSEKAGEITQIPKVDTIAIGGKQEAAVTYSKGNSSKKLDAEGIASLKAEADRATENLRKLVEELILKQQKGYKASVEDDSTEIMTDTQISTNDIEAAKLSISEDGEFGVKAVSDRLVDFAISLSGGDKTKLSELISAIDKGFAAAKEALGGELPDISAQTYDETMRKLNEWAIDTDS